jgi:hypothetical protein
MSSSSSTSTSPVYSVPSRRFDGRPDLSQYRNTTVSGDEQLTSPVSSLHPGTISATGPQVEDLTACWDDATWLQGVSEAS